jgi:hypothetical protein
MLISGLSLLTCSLTFLYRTATTEPGYIQKNIETVKHLFQPDETDAMMSRNYQCFIVLLVLLVLTRIQS